MINRIFQISLLCCLCFSTTAQDDFVELSGDIIQLALPAAAFGSTLIWKDDTKPVIQMLKTFGVSLVITQSSKWIIDRERPNGKGHGFPSGHASSAFTGAAALQKRFGWDVGIPSYILASYVGWTRVETDNHDYWDVIAGAAVGIGSAYLFIKPYRENQMDLGLSKNRDALVVNFSCRF